MTALDRVLAEAGDAFVAQLRKRLEHVDRPEDVDAARLGAQAAGWAAAALDTAETSLLARRIGPVYSTEELSRWLTAPDAAPLTGEAVRKRAKLRQLVGFRTDDRQWAFPEWQFDRVAGRLVPRTEIIELWQQLPHAGFLTDADLAAWMHTRLRRLDDTPAGYANRRGASAPLLADAVARLQARAA